MTKKLDKTRLYRSEKRSNFTEGRTTNWTKINNTASKMTQIKHHLCFALASCKMDWDSQIERFSMAK